MSQNISRALTSVNKKLGINLREFIEMKKPIGLRPRPQLGIVKTKEIRSIRPTILRFLNTYHRLEIKNRKPPNVEELMNETKLSNKTVRHYLNELENIGAIPRRFTRASLRKK